MSFSSVYGSIGGKCIDFNGSSAEEIKAALVSQPSSAPVESPKKEQRVWIGAVFNPDDLASLNAWLDRKMDTGVRGKPPHITLMYFNTRTEGVTHIPKYTEPIEAQHIGWTVLDDSDRGDDDNDDGGILVMLLKCKGVMARHHELMKAPGATWEYSEVRPHISVLKWARPVHLDDVMLPIYPEPLRLVGEKIEIRDA